MRLASIALFAVLVGCAGGPIKPVSALPTPAAQRAPGVRAEALGFGVSAEFPAAPHTRTEFQNQALGVHVTHEAPQSYTLSAVSTLGRDRPRDTDWLEAVSKKMNLEKRADVKLQSFRGIEVAGTYKERQVLARFFAVGDTLVIVEADQTKGKVDEPSARHFLDSIALELPWRIYASPTTKFSVMVPAHAIEIDKTEAHEGRSSSRAFFVGGEDQLTYWATGEEMVERNPQVTDEQILDGAIDGMQKSGAKVTWQAPIEHDGVHGRELLATSQGATMMGRVWLTERFIYVLLVSAKSREALQRSDSSKFYGSLVWY